MQMDIVQQQADLIGKKLTPFIEGLTSQIITADPPSTSPPSPSSLNTTDGGNGASQPSPPLQDQPANATLPPTPPPPPPPPPSSPPQPLPPPSLLPPALVTQQTEQQPNNNSVSPPSPPFSPQESSSQVSPPSSSLSPPLIPNPPTNPSQREGSNSNNGNGQQNNKSNHNEKIMIGIGIGGVLVIMFVIAVFFFRRKNKRSTSSRSNQPYLANQEGNPKHRRTTSDSDMIGTTKTLFNYEELSQITEGFSKRNVVGEGGFGCVYKGILSEGKPVAIKQLKSISEEGYREFKAEVEIISRVHHKHLVSLVGYCICEQHRFLIYDFVPNNTLDYHLHGKDLPVLEWSKRVKIAIGAAKGLAYLHEDCHPKIIHRDIKSSNILLDDEFEAQVADFGLARLNDTARSHISTRVMGTFGYMAPEYASSGKLTVRSDVFSFGVVLLELITGRKPVDTSQPLGEESLVEWARPRLIEAIEKGDISEVIDQRLEKRYVEREVFQMIETAAACVRHSALKRPRMVQVVRALDTIEDLSDLTNGVKVGQSTVYNSGQYTDEILRIFRRASDDSSDLGYYTKSYDSSDPNIR